ncbi:MAG: DEAD/DEAH box helicase [Pseudomonadota bacterium]
MIRSVVGDLVKKVRREIQKKIPAFNIIAETPAAPPRPREPSAPLVMPAGSGQRPLPQEAPLRKRPRRKTKRDSDLAVPQGDAPPGRSAPPRGEEEWSLSDFQVEEQPGRFRFHDLDLPDQVMHAVHDLGFEYCTPIQAAALPAVLDGRDVFGKAQTGTGKTAAFLLAILTRLYRDSPPEGRPRGAPRALVIGPTRELVMQLDRDAQDLGKYLPVRTMAVFGGMDFEKQQRALKAAPVDILAATPGRLLDFQRRGVLDLSQVEILVIDEADRMLDMGFIPDVSKIIRSCAPKDRRNTMLFSATLTSQIQRLAGQWTRDPVVIEIDPDRVAVDTVDQVVYIITRDQKFRLLYNLIEHRTLKRVLVFSNRRDWTRRIAERLQAQGIDATHLSGDVPQDQRVKKLERFREGKIRVLVATDVAARGIHVEGISHVVNYDLPDNPEDYVHRIGRTGRAGVPGISVSFATEFDAFLLPAVEEFLGTKLPCVYPEDDLLARLPRPDPPPPPRDYRCGGRDGGRGGDRGGGRGRSSGRSSGPRR